MSSNLNNVTNMTADDYFTMNRYEGKIYKTNNMQGRVLANYCKTDSAMAAEQKRIEQQLADFEQSIWHQEFPEEPVDSTQLLAKNGKSGRKSARAAKEEAAAEGGSEETATKTAAEKKKESSSGRRKSTASASAKRQKSSGGSSAPRVSARRQRR